MSEFLAEAQVLIRPNTTSFRAELQAQIAAATAGLVVPVGLTPGTGALQTAGALDTLNKSAKGATTSLLGVGTATAKLDAGLLGLRTALGSTAVIGLGAAALAAIALGKALRSSIDIASQTEQTLNVFRVTAGATADEMARVSRAASELGRDVSLPGVSAADAADAMADLSRAGLSVEDSIAGARGVLQLATAAMIDNAAATELAASGLNAFGLAGRDATKVADLLAGASIATQGSIEDVGIALQQSAAVARQVGFSIEQTVTALALLGRAGLQGSDAGTSLRTALIRLINPTQKAQKLIEQLGIEIRDATGAVRPDVFSQFAEATRELSPAVRDAALATIFGQDAIRAAAILAREGADGFNEMAEAVTEEGQAAELAAARTRGFSGELGALGSEAETAGLTIGKAATAILGAFIPGLTRTIGAANDATAAIERFVTPIRTAPKDISELADRIAEVQGQIDSFGDNPPPALIEQLETLVDQLRSEVGPQFRSSETDARGYALALADASDRSRELVGVSDHLASALADAASRFQLPTQALTDLLSQLPSAQQALTLGIAQARAAGDLGRELELQRQRERNQQAFIEKLESQTQTAGVAKQLIQANRNLEDTRNRIQSILDERAGIAKDAADDIREGQRDADDAFLRAISGREAELRRAEFRAAQTENLRDDLERQRDLRKFFETKIKQARTTINDAVRAAEVVSDLATKLDRAEAEIDRIEEEIAERRRQRRRERRERQRESLQLDIEIAQATGNRAKEIRAREAEIKRIQDEIRQTRRNSLQRKRLILELRQAQKDLRELQAEKQKTSDISKQVFFDFLQQQQGFAANLLGNLIPGFATAGLVGGQQAGLQQAVTPPSRALSEAAAVTQVQGRGLTQGQGDTQIAVLRQIRDALFQLTGRTAVPEARYQRATQSAFMDVIGT